VTTDKPGFWSFLRRAYATADPRSLGLLRLALGWLLFVDLARRAPDVVMHYTNDGWLTNHYALFRPMSNRLLSPHLAFSTPGEVFGLLLLQLVVYFLFMIGFRTKLMHALSALLLVGINSRNITVENGGYVVLTLLTVWTLFLPLGRRFSVDALLASLRERREGTAAALNDRSSPRLDDRPVVSLGVTALILQWATIYYFNVVHKTGPEWRDGSAVHYFLQQDRMITGFAGSIRDHLPLWAIQSMSYGTLVLEAAIAVLLISPFATARLRMVAWALVCVLHLSIETMVDLGPFSYTMIAVFFAFIPREFWEWAHRRLAQRRPRAKVEFDPESGYALTVCRLLKRFDSLERLRFAENLDVNSVAVEVAGKRSQGLPALRSAVAVLPMPALGSLFLRLPGVARLLKKQLAAPERASAYFDLEALPGTDEHAPPVTDAKTALVRVAGYGREIAVAFVMLVAISQVLIENRAVPAILKPTWRPAWVEAMVVYPRMFQGWSMFAPSPPTDDGLLVIDAVTKSGRKVDPLTGEAPSFDVQPPGGFHMNQITGDFHRRLGEKRFDVYLDGLREWVKNYAKRTGRPEDEIARFDIYFVEERVPPPGRPHSPPVKRKLLSFGSPPKSAAGTSAPAAHR